MVREGCRRRHSRPDSISTCNRSTPESREKNRKCFTNLNGDEKVLIDYRASDKSKKKEMRNENVRLVFLFMYILPFSLPFCAILFITFPSYRIFQNNY